MPAATSPSATDERFAVLDEAIRGHNARPDCLIEVLHVAQSLFGCLSEPVLWHVARALKQPPGRVYGVATFYHLFHLKPPGKHSCVVCTGTACFIKGSDRLEAAAAKATGLAFGQTSSDGQWTLAEARCVGTCGVGPVAVFDDDTIGFATPEKVAERLGGARHGS